MQKFFVFQFRNVCLFFLRWVYEFLGTVLPQGTLLHETKGRQ